MDVLILHGWNLSSERYQPLIRALRKKRYRVIAPDFPGFGTAMLPSRVFALDDYVTFTADFIKKNNMKKPIVIGHSFGGRVGIKLAGTKKSLISGLVLTGVPGVRFASKAKLSFFLIAAKVGGLVFSLPGSESGRFLPGKRLHARPLQTNHFGRPYQADEKNTAARFARLGKK